MTAMKMTHADSPAELHTAAIENRTSASWRQFETVTSRWGRITMLLALVCSLAGPVWLVYFSGRDVDSGAVWVAVLALAAVFGAFWIVEPIAYYPILGPAAMYQAFMVGNISNKLLPAALAAQVRIGAVAGSKRAELAAILAIAGAVLVHIVTLIVFVAILGSQIVAILPDALLHTVREYLAAAVLGGFLVQIIVSNRSRVRVLIVAAAVSVAVLGAVYLAPSMLQFATVIAVVASAVAAWLLQPRRQP